MTYFEILLTFILPPLVVLAIIVPATCGGCCCDGNVPIPAFYCHIGASLLLVLIALVYTTPVGQLSCGDQCLVV